MIFPTPETAGKLPQNNPKFQRDFVSLENFDFTNPRTWEVIETKGPKRPFSGHGTWEDTENKAVVGNVRNRNFHGDKLPQRQGDSCINFRALQRPQKSEKSITEMAETPAFESL